MSSRIVERTDNPYLHRINELAGPKDLKQALERKAEAASLAVNATIDLVKDKALAIPAKSPLKLAFMLSGGLMIAVGFALFFVLHNPIVTGVIVVTGIVEIALINAVRRPYLVVDTHGLWVVRAVITDYVDWVALKKVELDTTTGRPRLRVIFKSPERYNTASFSGRYRQEKSSISGSFKPVDDHKAAFLAIDPEFAPMEELAQALQWALEEFGTPQEVVPPRPVTGKIFVDEREFDEKR